MKRIVSMLMAMTLVLSLSMSVLIPSSAISYDGGNSTSTGVSAANPNAAYIVDKGTMQNVPVKIYAFTNSSQTVRVEVGNSVLTLPVTHRMEGGTWVSTIKYTRNNAYVGYGFGSEYDALNGKAVFDITIRHYGPSVATHALKASGKYEVQSKAKLPVLSMAAKDNDFYYFTTTNAAQISAFGSYGYFNTSFKMSTFDNDSSMRLRCGTVKTLQIKGSISHGMNSSGGLAFSGTYKRMFSLSPFGISVQ
jgi:hypothetical protein